MSSNPNREFPREPRLFQCCLLMLLMLGINLPALAQKTDLIYLVNGDRITGEIKEVRQAQMRLSTNPMGTVWIKWDDIERIKSDKWLQVELTDGTRFFGKLPESESARELAVETLKGEYVVSMDQVVRAEPIKVDRTFWERLDSNLRVGFNYTKASDVATWNIGADTTYRARRFVVNGNFNSFVTNKAVGDDSRQANLSATLLWYRPNRWFRWGTAALQTDDELGIDLRAIFSGGIGRFALQTHKTELYLAGGLAANQEWTVNSTSDVNLEGAIVVDWTYFKLYTPKSQISSTLELFPGISESDRIRGTFNIELRQELFADFFWDLTYRLNYDNKPPQGAQAKVNYSIITSLGYEF